MTTGDDRIQGWVDDVLDRARERLRDDLGALVRMLTEELAAREADAADEARRQAEAAGAALAAEAIAVERAAAAERLAQAVAAARAEAEADLEAASPGPEGLTAQAAEREATLAGATILLDAIRALDAAGSLTAVLDELATRAAAFVPRVAVLLRSGDQLVGWTWHGLADEAGAPRQFVVPLDEAGLAGLAARRGEPQTATGGAGMTAKTPLAPARVDRAALAVPLRVGGDVVGVLYADNEGEGPEVVPSAWPEVIETLGRHAERCLETVTARALPELLQAGVAERARRRSLRYDDEAAERYARLLVAEIKLYHEALVDEARRERNLLRKLRPQIERARQLYDERVAPAVRARTTYFEQEILRTLADGDPTLLGQST